MIDAETMAFLAMEEPLVHYILTTSSIVDDETLDAAEYCYIGVEGSRLEIALTNRFFPLALPSRAAVIVREFLGLFLGHHRLRLPSDDDAAKLAKRLAVNSVMEGVYDLPYPELPHQYRLPDKESAEFYYQKLGSSQAEPDRNQNLSEEIDKVLLPIVADFNTFTGSVNVGKLQSSYGHLLACKHITHSALPSKIYWPQLLRGFGKTTWKSDDAVSSYKRYSRRYGFPVPGRVRRPSNLVHIVIDTSASNAENFEAIYAELLSISKIAQIRQYQCDIDLVSAGQLTKLRLGVVFKGMGGTDLRPAIAAAVKDGAKSILVMTDRHLNRTVINLPPKSIYAIFDNGSIAIEGL